MVLQTLKLDNLSPMVCAKFAEEMPANYICVDYLHIKLPSDIRCDTVSALTGGLVVGDHTRAIDLDWKQ